MRLTEMALKDINTPSTRIKLAMALQCTEQTIIRYIDSNSDNLTKAAALAVIRQETGLDDSEILEGEEVNSGAQR